jgi:hypothetical protein
VLSAGTTVTAVIEITRPTRGGVGEATHQVEVHAEARDDGEEYVLEHQHLVPIQGAVYVWSDLTRREQEWAAWALVEAFVAIQKGRAA